MSESRMLCEKLYDINELSGDDCNQIRRLMLDYFASMIAGYQVNRLFSEKIEQVIFAQGGTEESTVFFSKKKCPSRSAAFLNSLYGHGAELDDGNKEAMGHVGVHIIPAVISLAEAEKKTQDEAMIAIATGYEAYVRISASAQPGMIARSFHSTGMAGTLACALACAKLMNLSPEEMEDAMALACTLSGGLLTYSESHQEVKPLNPAKAAENGVFAARLAMNGVKGPKNSLEGPNGWYRAVTDKPNIHILLDHRDRLLLHDCYIKLYPSCRHTHCGIDAAIALAKSVEVEAIKKINVFIYPNAIKLAGQIKMPNNADETKFSIHYTIACSLLYGEYGIKYMDVERYCGSVKDIITKISLVEDVSMENLDKGIRGARVEIIYHNDMKLEKTVFVPKGDPENPVDEETIIKKLETSSYGFLSKKVTDNLIDYISHFGEKTTINWGPVF